MKRNLMILALIGAFAFVAVPAFNSVSAQERGERRHSSTYQNDNDRARDQRRDRDWSSRNRSNTDWSRRHRSSNDWNSGNRRSTHGYRNYGQYRRTQVGNRRRSTTTWRTRSTWIRRHRNN
jgi:Ni/Co efflux regulator RcnB